MSDIILSFGGIGAELNMANSLRARQIKTRQQKIGCQRIHRSLTLNRPGFSGASIQSVDGGGPVEMSGLLASPGCAVPRPQRYAKAGAPDTASPPTHGPITRAFRDVLKALLLGFHNARSGVSSSGTKCA